MKEATGELNATVIVVVLIGVLSAFFFGVLWPMIKNNMNTNYKCSDAVCDADTDGDGWATCTYYEVDINLANPTATNHTVTTGETFQCPYKG